MGRLTPQSGPDARPNARHGSRPAYGGGRCSGFALMDVLVAGVLLSITLVALLGLSSRSVQAQIRGERLQRVSMLIDQLLSEVLAVGPEEYEEYAEVHRPQGSFDPPNQDYFFRVELEEPTTGRPYLVRARVWWKLGNETYEEVVETYIAPRLGDEPDPEREPETPIER